MAYSFGEEMKTLIKTAFLLFSSLYLSSCGKPDIRIKRKVAESEIVGTWQLDPKSSALAVDHDVDVLRSFCSGCLISVAPHFKPCARK